MTARGPFAVSAILVIGCGGCNCGGRGIPEVAPSGISDAGVIAEDPNPCEIDLDFGTVPGRQQVVASIEIKNVGSGTLIYTQGDFFDPEFELVFGTPQDWIPPGEYAELSIIFQPFSGQAGRVQSTFTIPTDGENNSCPSGADSVITVVLTATRS
jgi:hypothetical protein